jgi:transposase
MSQRPMSLAGLRAGVMANEFRRPISPAASIEGEKDHFFTAHRGAERAQGSGAAAPGRGGRMSRQWKTASVLRLLWDEDLDQVSRSLGVTAATLTGWRDAFVAAGEAALTTKPATGEDLEGGRLKARLGVRCRDRGKFLWPVSSADWRRSWPQTLSATALARQSFNRVTRSHGQMSQATHCFQAALNLGGQPP